MEEADMTRNPKPPSGFPESFGADVRVRNVDLDDEYLMVGGERLTEERAEQLAERAARGVGRPSLTAPGERSPALNLRIPSSTRLRLNAVAAAQGRSASEVVREALDDYLARH
ncbi:MAG: ribbon-helix-helix protein, CopG family [Micropruina sp.]|uniref:CopG family ribbon-helix-helix protein n=1 Tax=Micropruina sp. TaxID=2737536 RepID=UPI0039E63937